MNNAITFTLSDIVVVCTGFTAICIAISWIVKAIVALKRPNDKQNERLEAIESKLKEHDKLLNKDLNSIQAMENENHISMQALLALLEHGIDGNNIDQMKKAKESLQNYLIQK